MEWVCASAGQQAHFACAACAVSDVVLRRDLLKAGNKNRGWKCRHFKLRGDQLLYFDDSRSPLHLGVISLCDALGVCWFDPVPPADRQHGEEQMKFAVLTMGRVWMLECTGGPQKRELRRVLERCIPTIHGARGCAGLPAALPAAAS